MEDGKGTLPSTTAWEAPISPRQARENGRRRSTRDRKRPQLSPVELAPQQLKKKKSSYDPNLVPSQKAVMECGAPQQVQDWQRGTPEGKVMAATFKVLVRSLSGCLWYICENDCTPEMCANKLQGGLSPQEIVDMNLERLGKGLTTHAKLRPLTMLQLPRRYRANTALNLGFRIIDDIYTSDEIVTEQPTLLSDKGVGPSSRSTFGGSSRNNNHSRRNSKGGDEGGREASCKDVEFSRTYPAVTSSSDRPVDLLYESSTERNGEAFCAKDEIKINAWRQLERYKLGPGGMEMGPPDETPEEKLLRVERQKLERLQAGVRGHPRAAELDMLKWDPVVAGFAVEIKVEGRSAEARARQHYKVVGPQGKPQFRSIEHAVIWVIKRCAEAKARSAEMAAKRAALLKKHQRRNCPDWRVWVEATSAAERRHQCLEVLAALGNADEYDTFTEPWTLSDDAEDYRTVITEPMDLTTMAGVCKSDGYDSFRAFKRDLALIVSNQLTWNKERHSKSARILWNAVEPAFLAAGGRIIETAKKNKSTGKDKCCSSIISSSGFISSNSRSNDNGAKRAYDSTRRILNQVKNRKPNTRKKATDAKMRRDHTSPGSSSESSSSSTDSDPE